MNNILKLYLGSFQLVPIHKGGCKLISKISVIKLIFKYLKASTIVWK